MDWSLEWLDPDPVEERRLRPDREQMLNVGRFRDRCLARLVIDWQQKQFLLARKLRLL
jgi:hypothetical protein